MSPFHDKYYNGITLKLNAGVIATNPELEGKIQQLLKDLEACQYSTFHPDHTRNIYELQNWKTKQKALIEEKKLEDARRKNAIERERKLLCMDLVEIEEDKIKFSMDLERIKIGDKEVKNFHTKSGMKSACKKQVNEYLEKCSKEEFLNFIKDNRFYIYEEENYPTFNHNRCHITMDSYGNICLNWFVEKIRYYTKGKRNNKLYYRSVKLDYDTINKYYYCSILNLSQFLPIRKDKNGNSRYTFENHIRENNKFIKL